MVGKIRTFIIFRSGAKKIDPKNMVIFDNCRYMSMVPSKLLPHWGESQLSGLWHLRSIDQFKDQGLREFRYPDTLWDPGIAH